MMISVIITIFIIIIMILYEFTSRRSKNHSALLMASARTACKAKTCSRDYVSILLISHTGFSVWFGPPPSMVAAGTLGLSTVDIGAG